MSDERLIRGILIAHLSFLAGVECDDTPSAQPPANVGQVAPACVGLQRVPWQAMRSVAGWRSALGGSSALSIGMGCPRS
jgi:hypothetical protein